MSHYNLKGNAPKNNYLSSVIWCGVVVFSFSAIMAFMTTWFVLAMGGCAEVTEEAVEEAAEEVVSEEIATPEEEPIVSAVCDAEEVEVIPMEYIAEFRITAYCSCKKCCGKWADNRPNGIVYGASGQELKAGVSVASFLPFGTELYIDGLGEYVVQDRPAEWVFDKYGKYVVDVYFDNHQEACQFGLKHLDVYEIRG